MISAGGQTQLLFFFFLFFPPKISLPIFSPFLVLDSRPVTTALCPPPSSPVSPKRRRSVGRGKDARELFRDSMIRHKKSSPTPRFFCLLCTCVAASLLRRFVNGRPFWKLSTAFPFTNSRKYQQEGPDSPLGRIG